MLKNLSILHHKRVLHSYYNALFKMPLTAELANFVIKLQDKVEVPVPYYEHLIQNGIENCMKEREKVHEIKKPRRTRQR